MPTCSQGSTRVHAPPPSRKASTHTGSRLPQGLLPRCAQAVPQQRLQKQRSPGPRGTHRSVQHGKRDGDALPGGKHGVEQAVVGSVVLLPVALQDAGATYESRLNQWQFAPRWCCCCWPAASPHSSKAPSTFCPSCSHAVPPPPPSTRHYFHAVAVGGRDAGKVGVAGRGTLPKEKLPQQAQTLEAAAAYACWQGRQQRCRGAGARGERM